LFLLGMSIAIEEFSAR